MDSAAFVNEWEGVVAFPEKGEDGLYFRSLQAAAAPIVITRKPLKDPLEVAREKFPNSDWNAISPLPTNRFLQCLDECKAAMASGKSVRARELDTVFATVLQGCNDLSVAKGEGGKGYELFVNGKWVAARMACAPT